MVSESHPQALPSSTSTSSATSAAADNCDDVSGVPASAAQAKTPTLTPATGSPSDEGEEETTESSSSKLGGIVECAKQHRYLWIGIGVVTLVVLGLGLGLGLHFRFQKPQDNTGPVINLGYANYRGSYLNNGVSQFLGIRYAQPPLGDLRWRAPLEPESQAEDSLERAKEFKPICIGISDALHDSIDEDCLFLNIWGPTNATVDQKLPVMVFIQGGGYTRNANANWNGSRLVETSGNGIVFVNFNYRVGLWGFLAGEEVRRHGDLNGGLLDQRLLLRWVQKHIHRFGGDPDHVVIQGISAGAGSAALHLIAHGGRNDSLFAGAISESTFIPAHPPVSELEYQFNRTVEGAGCSDADSRISCLREKSTKELQSLNVPSPFPGRTGNPLFYWTPCKDGDLLVDSPTALFNDGRFIQVPLLFGTCTNEGTVFAHDASSSEEVISFLLDNYPSLTSSQTSNLTDLYPQESPLPHHNAYFPSASRAYGEATFICQTNNMLNDFNTTNSTWSYRYNVEQTDTVESGFGVPHVAEIPAVMGPDMLSYAAHPSYTSYNSYAVSLVMNYWLSFVKTLDPNIHRLQGSPEWAPWGSNQSRIVLQSQGTAMENVSDSERERCEFWRGTGPQINQ